MSAENLPVIIGYRSWWNSFFKSWLVSTKIGRGLRDHGKNELLVGKLARACFHEAVNDYQLLSARANSEGG